MSNTPFFIFNEHTSQCDLAVPRLSEIIGNNVSEYQFSSDNFKYLGLNEKFEANYFIGMRWIEWMEDNQKSKGIIWVKPKHSNIPFEQILWKCLEHPIVCKHLEQCYEVFPDEPVINVPIDFDDFVTPMLIFDFLIRVQKIVKKGLKKGFVTIQDNLNNKIKGKILMPQTIKHQLKKNNITQTHCSYQIHTTNCIENQIIKATLLQSQKYIYRFLKDRCKIEDILHYNLIAFDEVSITAIKLSDFNYVNNSSFYNEYKSVLNLAKVILKGFGFSINSDISANEKTVPPFYINMPELFERYCEVLLRNRYKDTLAGYQYKGYSETRLGKSKLRPDFIIPSENRIVDSKYKYWIENNIDLSGIMQLSLYSRHANTLVKLNNNNSCPILQLLYPNNNGAIEINFEKECNKEIEEYPDIFQYPVSMINL